MLFQLGALQFDAYPFPADESERKSGADFAAKDIIGAQRPREFVGEADETIVLRGLLLPHFMATQTGMNVQDQLDILDAMRASGQAQLLIRGDGRNMGWFFIERVDEKSRILDATGVGHQIEYQISLVKSPNAPGVAGILTTLLNLFG